MNNIRQFDIYWVGLDPTVGSEIKKARPSVIVSPDIMNNTLGTVVIVPLTKTMTNWPFRTAVKSTSQKSSAACDQIRSVSKKRLYKQVGHLKPTDQDSVLQLLRTMFTI